MIRVVVVDDHPLYRQALADTVGAAPELQLAGAAGDGDAGLKLIRDLDPDVAIVDVRLGRHDGPDIARAIEQSSLRTRILFISAHDDGATVHRALAAGGNGFLTKDAGSIEIRRAIIGILRGEVVLAPSAQAQLTAELRRQCLPEHPLLTEREQQMLEHIAEGQTVAEIATDLYLSQATVKCHLRSLYAKLEVGERAAAVATAMRRGLLS
ncbi:response regulator [Baekduia sp. Peel2402]|uniref:response regulator n=1 Tax=Baekduia sp. Peel2402 TaxID=3458296 RepID=UPI00403ED06B